MLRLDPPLFVITPRGRGEAIVLIDPSWDSHLLWVVALNNGQIWTFENPQVCVQANETAGRLEVEIPDDWRA